MNFNLHTPKTIYSRRHVPSWLMLSCAAGAVNGLAFMMCERFVTHISGTFTELGVESPRVGLVLDSAAVIFSFILGAFASILILQSRAGSGDRPRWATPLASVTLLLCIVAAAGQYGMFGPFGGTDDGEGSVVALLSLLAFAMGLQNAAVAVTTGLSVRTTHVTGPATDLGIHLGTALLVGGDERRSALRGAALRGGKILAFALGASLSVPLAANLGYLALLAPASFVAVATILSFTVSSCPVEDAIPQLSPTR